MAEEILKGYVIRRDDFNIFDEIITFLLQDGRKITCISLGSRKIQSKNSRNLFLGSYVELEVFMARADDKLSKLKKSNTIEPISWELQSDDSFQLLNELVWRADPSLELVTFYREQLSFVKQSFDANDKMLILIKRAFPMFGLSLSLDGCVVCGSKILQTFSPHDHGFLCPECTKINAKTTFNPDTSRLIFNLFYTEDIFDKYNLQVKKNALKIISQYVDDNIGLLLKTMGSY